MAQVQVAGIPWFAEDDYESFRAVLPLRAWHATYEAWLRAAEQMEKGLQERGITTVKAHVRSDAFIAWCSATGRDINTRALTAFGNEAAIRSHSGGKSH